MRVKDLSGFIVKWLNITQLTIIILYRVIGLRLSVSEGGSSQTITIDYNFQGGGGQA